MTLSIMRRPLFLWIVLIPNVLALIYFGLVASPVYVSTASLKVFNPVSTASSLSAMLSGGSGDGTSDGAFVFKDFAESWGEFRRLDRIFDLRKHFAQGDLVGRYGGFSSWLADDDIALWNYYRSHVAVTVDIKSGIASVDSQAYEPDFGRKLSSALLHDAVQHLSLMNDQEQDDMVRNAEGQKSAIVLDIAHDNAALAHYRAKIGAYDPNQQYISNLTLVNGLALKQADLQSQYQAVVAATPNSPDAKSLTIAMGALQGRITGTKGEIAANERASAQYDALTARRDGDVALLQQANLAGQQAQQRALQSRYYLNIISEPSEPVTAELPHRLMWISIVFAATILLWGLLR